MPFLHTMIKYAADRGGLAGRVADVGLRAMKKRCVAVLTAALCLMLVQQTAFAAIPEDYVVRHGDRESKKIAITVDDGWNMDAVYKIHELSIELDFPVTWFIVGKLFCAEDRELWEDALAHGDEFGSHTWKHAQCWNTPSPVRMRRCACRRSAWTSAGLSLSAAAAAPAVRALYELREEFPADFLCARRGEGRPVGCGADRTLSGVPRYPERLDFAVSRANGGLMSA